MFREILSILAGTFVVAGVVGGAGYAALWSHYNFTEEGKKISAQEELYSEQMCRDNRALLASRGHDVSGIRCDHGAAAKLKRAECLLARKQLKDAGNDVSSIKCESAS